MVINGKCHCGNIAFDLDWDEDPPAIPARACGCTFCVKHGGVWTSNPRSTLTVTVADPALVSAYAFGTRTPAWLRRSAASFDAEDLEARLARRRRNWIADVRIVHA